MRVLFGEFARSVLHQGILTYQVHFLPVAGINNRPELSQLLISSHVLVSEFSHSTAQSDDLLSFRLLGRL